MSSISFPSPAAAAPSCFGHSATIVGTDGRDELIGTPGADVIVGLGAVDDIDGRGGDDLICSGGGASWEDSSHYLFETVQGGSGDDLIDGGSGGDHLLGEGGNDLLIGTASGDYVLGGPGDDVIRTRAGDDHVNAGPGQDVVRLGGGADSGRGAEGNDVVYGGTGSDALGSRRGFVQGGSTGLPDDHDVSDPPGGGELGDDIHRAGPGRDLIAFGPGNDVLVGGSDDDEASLGYVDSGQSFVADLIKGRAAGVGRDSLQSIEDVSAFSKGTIHLIGNEHPNQLAGSSDLLDSASTVFEANSGDDYVTVWLGMNSNYDSGAAEIYAGSGEDVVVGGEGDDLIFGGDGDDFLAGEGGINTIDGGPGTDTCRHALLPSNCEG